MKITRYAVFSCLLMLFAVSFANAGEYESVKIEQESHDSSLQSNFVRIMQNRSMEQGHADTIKSPFLLPFIYKPITIPLSGEIPRDCSLHLYTDIRNETYVPLVACSDEIEMKIIDPIPAPDIRKLEKYPDRIKTWLANRKLHAAETYRTVIVSRKTPIGPADTLEIGVCPRVNTFDDSIFVHLINKAAGRIIIASEGARAITKTSVTDSLLIGHLTDYILDVIAEHHARARFFIENLGSISDSSLVGEIRRNIAEYYDSLPNLPEHVFFRGSTQSFNFRYYLAAGSGTIWMKSNTEVTGKIDAWRKLDPGQLPRGLDTIKSFSCDGVAFLIKDGKDVFHRSGEFFDGPAQWVWASNMGWLGLPFLSANVLRLPDDSASAWDVTDASARANNYEDDLAGNRHVFLPGLDGKPGGVAHIYALGTDSLTIYSNDFWVSADWRRIIAGPMHGRLKMVSLSASGSTMFVMTKNGDMFTRYWNFNTDGAGSPSNTYTLDPQKARAGNFKTCRLLPPEQWWHQPPIREEKITGRITILQTGMPGNQERELRVEGCKDSATGFFHKRIYDTAWSFTPTSEPLKGQPIDNRMRSASDTVTLQKEGLLALPRVFNYEGWGSLSRKYKVRISGFHFYDSPAYLRLEAEGREIVLPVYKALKSPISSNRNDFFRKRQEPITYKAYLELPQRYTQSSDSLVQNMVKTLQHQWKNDKGRYFYGTIIADESNLTFQPE